VWDGSYCGVYTNIVLQKCFKDYGMCLVYGTVCDGYSLTRCCRTERSVTGCVGPEAEPLSTALSRLSVVLRMYLGQTAHLQCAHL